jgi:hypothetical protein
MSQFRLHAMYAGAHVWICKIVPVPKAPVHLFFHTLSDTLLNSRQRFVATYFQKIRFSATTERAEKYQQQLR